MGVSLRKLEEYLLALPRKVRAHLAELLWASLDEDAIADAWDEEAERRYNAYLAGEVKAVPAHEVLAKMRARLLNRATLVREDEDIDVELAWSEEIKSRIDDFRSGREKGIPADEVFGEIDDLLH